MQFHPNDLSDLDDLTEEHLGFSALSDGLGFSKGKQAPHPATLKKKAAAVVESEDSFEEEPPVTQEKSRQMAFSGTGAVAAGPMRPAPSFSAKPNASATASNVAAKVLAEPAAPQYLRLGAFFLDALFVFLPLSLAWLISFGSNSKEIFLQDIGSPLGLFAVIFAAYFLLSESFGGQSLGKMVLGLRVVEDDKYQKPTGFRYAALRLGLFLVSVLFLGIGFLASFWDSKRRPWHDRYSNSIVRRTA